MCPYKSLCVFMGPYRSLCISIDSNGFFYNSFIVLIGFYKSLCVLIDFEMVLMEHYRSLFVPMDCIGS